MKKNFPDLYQKVRYKAIIFGSIFIGVLIFRYLVYIVLQFTDTRWLKVESTKGEIPFYISEIFVSLCYLKFMVSLYQKNKN